MKVLVDTSVWSLILRRKSIEIPDAPVVDAMKSLITSGTIAIIGAIRQEILSGIAFESIFYEISSALSKFPDLDLDSNIYVKAASYYNICRKSGIQGSHTDFLICSVSNAYNVPIFTLDKDFENYRKYLPITLYEF